MHVFLHSTIYSFHLFHRWWFFLKSICQRRTEPDNITSEHPNSWPTIVICTHIFQFDPLHQGVDMTRVYSLVANASHRWILRLRFQRFSIFSGRLNVAFSQEVSWSKTILILCRCPLFNMKRQIFEKLNVTTMIVMAVWTWTIRFQATVIFV